MPTINRFADFHDDIAAWRRDIHAHPELLFDVHRTAGIVEKKLAEFGVDVLDQEVVVDGNIITSTGPATAVEVAFTLLEMLTSTANADIVRTAMGFK